MNQENLYLQLKSEIEKAQSIIIFSHVNPDGDTIGSNLALKLIIERQFGKKADSVFIGKLPGVYSYLPAFEQFIDAKNINPEKVYDLAISVDVAAQDRMVYGCPIYDKAKFKVNIDHHQTNIGYGDLNIIEPTACVGVILHKIFKEWNCNIDIEVARCIYTSLLTDTGGFRYENTTPEAFMIASELVEAGVSPSHEFRVCYETKPQNMVQFQAYIVFNTIFYNNGKIAVTKITRSDMSRFNATEDFSEGIVEVLRTCKNVEIAVILKETLEGYTKVSLRSKTVDIIPIVLEFGGGGHKFAAGCTIKKPLAIAYEKLLQRIQSELKCEII
ncbi:MAG: bifunctional oligoribonuclease/PAP phosphatase NrnA [Candidatus Gastranaerophilales bacterium]|nr:bifunctional oligoribonuclease/PAP phosphatase NrnA [Candidatus Gastranaerophilales bacterium]